MLDSLCEPVGLGPLVVLRLGVAVWLVLALLNLHNELDCEENKLEVKVFDK